MSFCRKTLIKKAGAENAVASLDDRNKLHIKFDNNSLDGIASENDRAIIVVYSPSLKKMEFTLHGGRRADGVAMLDINAAANSFEGHQIETWIGFISEDEEEASDSVWTGKFDVMKIQPSE